jgi:hypothetical protein
LFNYFKSYTEGKKIAAQVGYDDLSAFRKIFIKITGQTLKEFKNDLSDKNYISFLDENYIFLLPLRLVCTGKKLGSGVSQRRCSAFAAPYCETPQRRLDRQYNLARVLVLCTRTTGMKRRLGV